MAKISGRAIIMAFILTLDFELDDHVLEVRDPLIELRGLALVAALVGLAHVVDDEALLGDLVLAVGAAADDGAAHVPRDARLGVPAHVADQYELGDALLHTLAGVGRVERDGLC